MKFNILTKEEKDNINKEMKKVDKTIAKNNKIAIEKTGKITINR